LSSEGAADPAKPDVPPAPPAQDDAARRPATAHMPFALRLIIAFLVIDSLERAVELGVWWRSQPSMGQLVGLYMPNVALLGLLSIVDLMLVLFMLLRTAVGRWFGVLIFGFHIAYLVWDVSSAHPELWLYASAWGRARIPLTVGIDSIAIAWLLSARAGRYLHVR
jgi:hypothetical protein